MNTDQIRRHMQDGKLSFGVDTARKLIRTAGAQSVLIATNAPASESALLRNEAALAGVEVIDLDVANTQLGVVCRRPHAISFCTVKK